MNKLIIIGASIAGILGTMDIITTDPLKYGACALLGITALMTLNELNPPKKQDTGYKGTATQQTAREKPKDIWGEFGEKEVENKEVTKEEVKPKEKEFKITIEDTNVQEQNKIQNPEEV